MHPSSPDARVELMWSLVDRYSAGFPTRVHAPSTPPLEPNALLCVLLTGSTGALGTYLLAALISSPRVQRIYAYNRAHKTATLLDRQRAALCDHGLSAELASHVKVRFLEGLATDPHLGMAEDMYQELRTSITTVVHAAWPLGFNKPLLSFEPNIAGTANLIDLALESTHDVHFVFTSSLAPVANWQGGGPAPEALVDPTSARTGYGESKWVTEQVWRYFQSLRIASLTKFGVDPRSSLGGTWPAHYFAPDLSVCGIDDQWRVEQGGVDTKDCRDGI